MKATILLLSMFATYPATYGKDTNPACVTIVRIPIPWYAPKFYVKSRMKKSVPEYQAASGLIYKYFTFGENGTFGGIYLWKNRAAADAWFTPAWIQERSKKYGIEVTVPRYDVLAVSSARASTALLEGKFVATLAKYESRQAESRVAIVTRFKKEETERMTTPGLLRTYLIETEPNQYAAISLWEASVETENQPGEKFRVPLAIANPG